MPAHKDDGLHELVHMLSKDGSVHVTDELINTVTSLAGACFALLGGALLIVQAAAARNVWAIVAFSVYSLSLLSLFVSSTLHHGIDGSEATNRRLRTFDYLSVFLLIGGTITPLVLIRGRNPAGWAILGAIWAIAAVGITLRSVYHELPRFITNTFYIVLGWLTASVIVANLHLPPGALALMVAGGLVYSIGFAMFVAERPNLLPGKFGFHELWHVLVIVGASLHYLMMYLYLLPK